MSKLKAPKSVASRSGSAGQTGTGGWIDQAQALYYGHKNLVTGGAVAIIVLIAGILGFNYIQGERARQAEELLGGIIMHYEGGDYRTALDGSGETLGLIDLIEQYGGTPSGNMARFYAGDALFRLADYDESLVYFAAFDAKDDIMGASAVAGQAAIYELQQDYRRAGALYRRAAGMEDNKLRTPVYLIAAARAYSEGGQFHEAEEMLEMIIEQYPDTDLQNEVEFRLGFVRARMN